MLKLSKNVIHLEDLYINVWYYFQITEIITIITQKFETSQFVSNLLKARNRLITFDFQTPIMSINYLSKKWQQLQLNLECNMKVFFSPKMQWNLGRQISVRTWATNTMDYGACLVVKFLLWATLRRKGKVWGDLILGTVIDEDVSSSWDEIAMFSSSTESEAMSFWGGIKLVAFLQSEENPTWQRNRGSYSLRGMLSNPRWKMKDTVTLRTRMKGNFPWLASSFGISSNLALLTGIVNSGKRK